MQLTDKARQPPLPSRSLDAFDTLDGWKLDPVNAFSSWLENQARYKTSSKEVYVSMFNAFVTWLAEHDVAFHSMESHHLASFCNDTSREVRRGKEGKLEKAQRYRYVRLVERAFDHLRTLGHAGGNPGRRAAKERVGIGHNEGQTFFSVADRTRLIAYVQECPDVTRKDREVEEWLELRDKALAGVMIGGGLKVGEAERLSVNCITPDGEWISVKANGHVGMHRAKILPEVRDTLLAWCEVRRRLDVPGDRLFPPSPRGSIRHRGMVMTPSTIFRRIQHVIRAAGLTIDENTSRACCQSLRNTYAAVLFDEGESDDLVTQHMGLALTISATRMRQAWVQVRRAQGGVTVALGQEVRRGETADLCPVIA